jgi:sn-glycerol 3-phosphate transport system permease protein
VTALGLLPAPTRPRSPRGSVRSRRRRREAALGYLLVVPALLVFSFFSFYPFLRNFQLALYQSPPVPGLPNRYVGFGQFGQVLSSSNFLESLLTTVVFVLLVVPISLFLGLVLAVAAQRKLAGLRIYRTIFSSTVVSSVAVAAVVFGTLMNPVVGLLPTLGINPVPPLLENTTWALPAIAVMSIWQFLGLSFIIMSAGLQSVPEEVLEAARIDGASTWTRFWRVTVPLLSPTIFFAVVVGTIYAFQTFGQIDILIGYANDPARLHVNVLIYNIVTTLQQENNVGVAAILSIALFVLTLLLTLVQMRLLERRVSYGR